MGETRDRVLIAGSGIGPAMAALAAAGIGHSQIVVLNDGPDYALDLDMMMDRLDVLSMFAADDRPRDRMGFRHPHPPKMEGCAKVINAMFIGLSGRVDHIDTPKPMSKRRARRLRGRATPATASL